MRNNFNKDVKINIWESRELQKQDGTVASLVAKATLS